MFDFQQGEILLFDKPYTWTSFDLVKKVRNLVRVKKVGHAGTLDPLATGLMILCTGAKTKSIEALTGIDKTYTGKFRLGMSTPSYDLETEADAHFPIEGLDEQAIRQAAAALTGNLQQLPPAHSAIKVGGKRLYKDARKGIAVKLEPRSVQVLQFEITEIKLPEVSFLVSCSKGTYIRSLVHDLGKSLGNGAVLTELCRTAVGEYQLADAWKLADFEVAVRKQQAETDAGNSDS